MLMPVALSAHPLRSGPTDWRRHYWERGRPARFSQKCTSWCYHTSWKPDQAGKLPALPVPSTAGKLPALPMPSTAGKLPALPMPSTAGKLPALPVEISRLLAMWAR